MTEWRKAGESPRPMMARAAAEVQPLAQVVGDIPDEHVITVAERRVSVDYPTIIQNNMNTDTVDLVLDGEWDGMSVVCYIGHPGDLGEFEWEGKPFTLPVYDTTGSIDVTVVGLSADGKTRLVTVEAKGVMNVIKSGEFEGSVPPEDQPDLLGQILAAKGEAEDAAQNATTAASTANSAASKANSAASSANSAATSANSAATKANSAAVDAQNAYDTLQPYMATIDSCANILHREVGPDSVVTADDSFPCKPVEMTVYGNTVQNLWVNPNGTAAGLTVTANANGSITVSGTSSGGVIYSGNMYALKPNTTYISFANKNTSSEGANSNLGVYEYGQDSAMITAHTFASSASGTLSHAIFTTDSNILYAKCTYWADANATVSGTYRVMIREATEEEVSQNKVLDDHWCPPGLNSVGQLREDEKNLWVNPGTETKGGVTLTANSDGSVTVSGTSTASVDFRTAKIDLAPEKTYVLSIDKMIPGLTNQGFYLFDKTAGDTFYLQQNGTASKAVTTVAGHEYYLGFYLRTAGVSVSGTYKVMLNEGSTASPWVPPESESCAQVVTAGKNLLGSSTFTETVGQGGCLYFSLPAGTYTLSCYNAEDWWTGNDNGTSWFIHRASGSGAIASTSMDRPSVGSRSHATFTLPYSGNFKLNTYKQGIREMATDLQLELGSTATDYEPPQVTTTPIDLQGHTLNALPDGTRDELHIDGGGNVVLEKRVGQDYFAAGDDGYILRPDSDSFTNGDAYNTKGFSQPSVVGQPYDVIMSDAYAISSDPSGSVSQEVNSIRKLNAGDAAIVVVKDGTKPVSGTVVYPLATPQTISLGTITPPTMAAPNVTAYVAGDTPAEMTLDYVRDVNIVHSRLEERVAALELASATS